MAATVGAGKGVSVGTGVTAGTVGVAGVVVSVDGSTAVAGTVVGGGSGVAGEATAVSDGGEDAPGASVGVPSEQARATATMSRDARMKSGPVTIRHKTARRLIFNIFSFPFKIEAATYSKCIASSTVVLCLTRTHRGRALGTALEEARVGSFESGITILEQKTARKKEFPIDMPQNNPGTMRIVFDDHRLMVNANLLPLATFA